MTWADELSVMLSEARGDLGIFLTLVALRRTENGREGKEFGVLSVSAPTYRDQAHVAANSIRNQFLRDPSPRNTDGTFSNIFLLSFSRRWAPPKVANDPDDLNAHHAKNLLFWHTHYLLEVVPPLRALSGPASEDPSTPT